MVSQHHRLASTLYLQIRSKQIKAKNVRIKMWKQQRDVVENIISVINVEVRNR